MTESAEGGSPASRFFSPDALGQGLLKAMLEELKRMPNMWAKMNESQQEVSLRRLEVEVRNWTLETMRVLFSAKVPACSASLGNVNVKDDIIEGKIAVSRSDLARHELADRVGQSVIVVMVNADSYLQRMNEVKGDANQRQLFDDDGSIRGTDSGPKPQGGPGGTGLAEQLDKLFNLPDDDSHSPKAEDFKLQLAQDIKAKGVDIPTFFLDQTPMDSLVEIRAWLDGLIDRPAWFHVERDFKPLMEEGEMAGSEAAADTNLGEEPPAEKQSPEETP